MSMRRNLALAGCLAVALTLNACQDQKNDITAPTAPGAGTSELHQPAFTRATLRAKLPASVRVSDLPDPAVVPTACDDDTDLNEYFLTRAFQIPFPTLLHLVNDLLADQVPTYEALLFETRNNATYFGYHGEYNERMDKTEREVKRFWDIKSNDIQVLAMHGTVLAQPNRTVPTYTSPLVFDFPGKDARAMAADLKNIMKHEATVNRGDHPLFTFNAFAFSTLGDPDLPPIPDKIVMGDGILDGYKAIGFDDVALPAIFAHEFGHHIQYERHYFDELPPLPPDEDPATHDFDEAELTRYSELMADAFSAYYLVHARGGLKGRKRVAQFLQVFFEIGDCQFANPGHHGTPIQRMRAAEFGFDAADRDGKRGRIMTSSQFHELFRAAYTGFVAGP